MASPIKSLEEVLAERIEGAIRQEIETAVEEELKTMRQRVEDRVRGSVGAISARVLERFEFERHGHTLVIRVNFSNEQQ